MAVNDKLLDFKTETMPYIGGRDFFVPVKTLEYAGVFAISSNENEFVRLYRGVSRYVDFHTASGITEDQDGNTMNWPSARRIGSRFYVPLRQSCDYFSLTYDIIEVPRDIISNEQMWIIRIISSASLNNPTFLSLNKNALKTAYDDYYPPPAPPSTPTTDTTQQPPPIEEVEPPPDFSSVTIHLSFFDISGESAGGILDLLDIQSAPGYHSCFFVSADDIKNDPGFIRRISGSGYSIGILLTEGTFDEYLKTSALLFEAAKIKTILVAVDESIPANNKLADDNGLILWESVRSLVDAETQTVDDFTMEEIPQESGARRNLMFPCSEIAASILPGVISFLMENNYTLETITEMVAPD